MIRQYWKTTLAITLPLAFGTILGGCSVGKQSAETLTASVGGGATIGRAGTQVGSRAPDFQLPKIGGATVSLADMRGKPAVIVFWAAWCSSCKEETPRINALAAEYGGKGVRVLGINVKDSLAGAEAGVKEFGIRYPVARDPDARVARAYSVRGTPTVIFLDRRGVVRYFANELPHDYAWRLDGLLAENF
jgi:peroxiredoxin